LDKALPRPETVPAVSAFRVLVVEDQFLIAMDLNAILTDAGFDVIGPVGTVAAALDALRAERPDAAILDVNLRGERSTPVAEALQAMHVPFVLASSYLPPSLAQESALAAARNLGKPTPPAAVLAAMCEYRDR
jgi:DNA-binding response OmpR family regulator